MELSPTQQDEIGSALRAVVGVTYAEAIPKVLCKAGYDIVPTRNAGYVNIPAEDLKQAVRDRDAVEAMAKDEPKAAGPARSTLVLTSEELGGVVASLAPWIGESILEGRSHAFRLLQERLMGAGFVITRTEPTGLTSSKEGRDAIDAAAAADDARKAARTLLADVARIREATRSATQDTLEDDRIRPQRYDEPDGPTPSILDRAKLLDKMEADRKAAESERDGQIANRIEDAKVAVFDTLNAISTGQTEPMGYLLFNVVLTFLRAEGLEIGLRSTP